MNREHIEELLELCWTAREDGLIPLHRDQLPEQLRCFLPHPISADGEGQQQTIEAMIREGLLLAEGRRIQLSPQGAEEAKEIVRRHRLTEVLLHSVLDVSDASVESTACQVEHILNREVTDAVCAFLGHPPSCPHGREIPRRACCDASRATVEPLIVPVARLIVGEEATVVLMHSKRHEYLQRLTAFGLAPGSRVRLHPTRPALSLGLGEPEWARDAAAGREIFVKQRAQPHPPTAVS